MREDRMKRCPLLRQERAIYCKNFPLKKMIPFERIFQNENLCLKRNHKDCPLYSKGMVLVGKDLAICPFVGFETVSYCVAFPLKKIAANSIVSSPCNSLAYVDCPIYKRMAGTAEEARRLTSLHGFMIDEAKLYLEGHLWMRRKNGVVRIGLDDFAQFILGPIASVRLREKGEKIGESEWYMRCEVDTGEVELLAPFRGVVEDVNERLLETPSLLNLDPYGGGWLFDVRLEVEPKILNAPQAKEFMEGEIRRLEELLAQKAGITMADGGEFVREIRNLLRDKASLLVKEFLKGKEV